MTGLVLIRIVAVVMLTAEQIELLRAEPPIGANRLPRALEMAGVTQVQIATAIGHTQPYVSSVINGKYSALPIETARKFAEFFGCSMEDLFPARDERQAVNS